MSRRAGRCARIGSLRRDVGDGETAARGERCAIMGSMLIFEPKRRTRLFVAEALAPLFVGAVFFLWASLRMAGLGARLSDHVDRRTDDGPFRVEGVLAPLRASSATPLGQPAPAWVAVIGAPSVRGSEPGAIDVLCAAGSFADVAVRRSDGYAYRLLLSRPNVAVRVDEGNGAPWLRGEDARVGVDIGALASSRDVLDRVVKEARGLGIPLAMHDACGAEIQAGGDAAVYRERPLPEGTRVTVLACKQGNDLVPCDDGLDAVTTRSFEEHRARITRGATPLFLLGGVFSLLSLLTVGFGALSLASRPRRTFR